MSVHHATTTRPSTSWLGLPTVTDVLGHLALVARYAAGIRAARHPRTPRTTEPAERDENGDAS